MGYSPCQVVTNQIICNNPALAQQLSSGKLQVASINGQQVLIRPTGNGQAQVVAQITQQNNAAAASPVKQVAAQPQPQPEPAPPPPPPPKSQAQEGGANQIDQATMEQLLAGQPPGTVIKCVTAQVIQTTQGPRIVLQGLHGSDFTQSQLTAVQHQVKQQLLKGSFFIQLPEVLSRSVIPERLRCGVTNICD